MNILNNAVFLKVIASTRSANAAHAQAIIDLSKVTCGAADEPCLAGETDERLTV